MRRLRAECPWKREQTHASLSRYLLEEAHETLEAIDDLADGGDPDHLREELGDLLLQVYFHAAIAEGAGTFTLDDVARGIVDKMHRRNPHVFGDAETPATAAEVDAAWQAIKQADAPRRSPTDGLPETLPALLYAAKAVERGLEPSTNADGLGDRLLSLVAEAVASGVDPEQALRTAVRRAGGPSGASSPS
ncbi:MazG family protein [Nocardioides flavescens]|uniref:Nucleoside triphosphate pyrophosphohydrolase n=1 Tax=Nocardioides flavescens TaxID=2691959 RepID=A0A6L7F0H6_9ACTN|nr:MazG family protein [Nocardioides flavescens]MXG90329.1 nucleoside triphosphate pyrophosphohydrolase [Nocardioides flavescens]